ncbi:hypothetical protein GF406_14690 [candidate division KSB1 bacterium]|nr:hypothetical protein [candidate division KSB1 bacterium]
MSILNRYTKLDDERLMRLVQKREAGAFDVLYKRYSKMMLRYFFRMLNGDQNKAEDFLQETFLRVYERSAQFNTEHVFCPWLFTIAHNLCDFSVSLARIFTEPQDILHRAAYIICFR